MIVYNFIYFFVLKLSVAKLLLKIILDFLKTTIIIKKARTIYMKNKQGTILIHIYILFGRIHTMCTIQLYVRIIEKHRTNMLVFSNTTVCD